MNYEEIEFGAKGIIKVNSPEGVLKITTSDLKTQLIRIEAVNTLLKAGKSVKSHVKDNEVLKELTTKISGEIEIVSFETI